MIIFVLGAFVLAFFIPSAFGDVWIPDNEYVGFYDSNGIYQVVGVVKNTEEFPIIPTIGISIQDGTNLISHDFQYVSIMPDKEMPFKFAFPQVSSHEPVLQNAQISFIRGVNNEYSVHVIYDDTLIVHPDGHISGQIINNGTQTVSEIRLLALIHGDEHQILDMGENISPIHSMKPGEIRDFKMYPDPLVQSKVWYYSCFAVGDLSVITLNAQRNNEIFTIRYDSRILISYPEFDQTGESLSFRMNQGWPLQTFVNFEFPKFSDREEFEVYIDDEMIESIQSIDDMGNWHVAFTVEEQTSGELVISGFDPEAESISDPVIPDWVRNNAGWWSQEKISDEDFISGIEFLIKRNIVSIGTAEHTK